MLKREHRKSTLDQMFDGPFLVGKNAEVIIEVDRATDANGFALTDVRSLKRKRNRWGTQL